MIQNMFLDDFEYGKINFNNSKSLTNIFIMGWLSGKKKKEIVSITNQEVMSSIHSGYLSRN